MILELYPPPGHDPIVVTATANEDAVRSTISAQPWTEDLTFVVLRVDDDHWLEVSGSLDPETGLSARYAEAGQEHVSDGAPASLAACEELLLSYLRGDDRWRRLIVWGDGVPRRGC